MVSLAQGSQPDYIRWFRSAAPYINKHRGQTFVVQFGGELMESAAFTTLIHDLVLLNALGIQLVLVHGARPQIDRRLGNAGLAPRFADGRRITDLDSLAHVKDAVGTLRVELEARLSMGLANSPMAGAQIRVVSGNYVTARPLGVRGGIDFGFSGEVRRVDVPSLERSLSSERIVLLGPLGFSPTGEVFNVWAQDVATSVAVALSASKLVMLASSPDARAAYNSLGRQLSVSDARQRLATERRSDGGDEIGEQLSAAVHACHHGVTRAHLIDGTIDGALLLELFTRDGIGTMVSADQYDIKRQAHIDDVPGILALITPLEEQGVLVRRSRDKLEREVERFTVMERDGAIIACASLHPFANAQAMELACLAVHPQYRNGSRGDILLSDLETSARSAGATVLFVLTTHTAQWFMERGYESIGIDTLPVERQALYNYRRNSKVLAKRL